MVAVDAQLAERAAEMRRLREKFTPAHPEVQRVQSEIDELQASRATRADQILLGIEAEAAQVRARERELRAALADQKALAAAQTRSASKTEALRKEADSSKNLYEVLLQKLNETDIASSLKANNVTIVERAVAPTAPVHPDKRRFSLAGLGLGLLAGLLLVLGLDLWHDTVKSADELEHHLQLDLLASIPRHAGVDDPAVTEAYQKLRTALIFSRPGDGGLVVLVTGTVPQEGKTSTAVGTRAAARRRRRGHGHRGLRPAARPAARAPGAGRASRGSPRCSLTRRGWTPRCAPSGRTCRLSRAVPCPRIPRRCSAASR